MFAIQGCAKRTSAFALLSCSTVHVAALLLFNCFIEQINDDADADDDDDDDDDDIATSVETFKCVY